MKLVYKICIPIQWDPLVNENYKKNFVPFQIES